MEKEREKGFRKDIQDINRDIGKHFDVKYSPTSEARRDIRVRYHLDSGSTSPPLVLSDLRTYLYNFLFAKTADHLSPGQLFVTTSNSDCPQAAQSLSLFSTRLNLPPTSDFLTQPKLCSRDLRTSVYLNYATTLAENKDAFFCFCESGPCTGLCTGLKPSEIRQRIDDG